MRCAREHELATPHRIVRKEGNVLFNDALKHILFTVIWRQTYGRKEMFYLTMHSTHFIYGYMASDIRLTDSYRKEGRKCFI